MSATNIQRPIGFSPAEISAMVNESVVFQHWENAAFLWLQRNLAVMEPHYLLNDIADLDERIEANIDGLRIAGDYGWRLAEEGLQQEEPGEVFTAGILALESNEGKKLDTVAKVACLTRDNYRALVSAIGWLADEHANKWIPLFLRANSAAFRCLGIAGSAIRRMDPGDALVAAINDPDLFLKSRALKAAGELKRKDLLPLLKNHFSSEHAQIRYWATWSATLMGDRTGIEVFKSLATLNPLFSDQAIDMLVRILPSQESQPFLNSLAKYPDKLRSVIIGAGSAGDPIVIPWLLQQLENPEMARVAGESISMITGVDIAYEDLDAEAPEGLEVGPTEEPEDENTVMDKDEELPWPNIELMKIWWKKSQSYFPAGRRYLTGEPISPNLCKRVLTAGYQRQRAAAALELALQVPDQPLFEVRTRGKKQQMELGSWTS